MSKLTLSTITSGYGTVDALNANFAAIVTAFENTLSRDGTTPNAVTADLDLNGKSILNQGNPFSLETFNWRGTWLTATAYAVGDAVESGGSGYVCVVAHTSGTFATDLAAVKWQLFATAGISVPVSLANGGLGASNANVAAARSTLGLGTMATQAASAVAITGGSVTGITDLAVADGGTGASTHTANAVLVGNGTSALSSIAPGTTGNVLTSNGTTWASAAATVPSGGLVQVANVQTGAVATGTTVMPYDDTIPQNTEGDQYMSLAITPAAATNKLKITVTLVGSEVSNPADQISVALFQDTTANALAAVPCRAPTSFGPMAITFTHYMTAGTTSATTFKVRAGLNAAGTFVFNGDNAGNRLYGGVCASSITIEEIKV